MMDTRRFGESVANDAETRDGFIENVARYFFRCQIASTAAHHFLHLATTSDFAVGVASMCTS